MFNIYACCRLCLKQKSSALMNCTEVDELSDAIHNMFGFKILPTDNCSTKICRDCTEKITSYSMYRTTVLNNQKSIELYQDLQAKLHFNTEIKEEANDDDIMFLSQDGSSLMPVLVPIEENPVPSPGSAGSSYKTSARKSTAKPALTKTHTNKQNVKLKKLRILCRRLKEADVSHVFLNKKDRKFLRLRGKRDVENVKYVEKPIEKNSPKINESKAAEIMSTKLPTVKIKDKSIGGGNAARSAENSPIYIKLNKYLESVLQNTLNRPSTNPPIISQSKVKCNNQNVPTTAVASTSSGMFYINPVAATIKTSNFKPIAPKPSSGMPTSNQIPDVSHMSTIGNTIISSNPIVGGLPIITDVYNNMQNMNNLSQSTARKTIPQSNTAQSAQSRLNQSNIVFVGSDGSTSQANFPTHYTITSFLPNSQNVKPPAVQQSNLGNIQGRYVPPSIAQRLPQTIKSETINTGGARMTHIHSNRSSLTSMEPEQQIRRQEGEVKFSHQAPLIRSIHSGNSAVRNIVNSVSEAYQMSDQRVKVLTVNELNMRAAEVNSTVENRKLPIRITLVKIRNEVQIKLTDSKNKDIHFNNLTPQEQAAVKSSLLQPASKAQILAAIKTCMPDKYSQEMLSHLGLSINDWILK